jgi:hypothetical protein
MLVKAVQFVDLQRKVFLSQKVKESGITGESGGCSPEARGWRSAFGPRTARCRAVSVEDDGTILGPPLPASPPQVCGGEVATGTLKEFGGLIHGNLLVVLIIQRVS